MRKLAEYWGSPKAPCDRVSSMRIDSYKTFLKSFGVDESNPNIVPSKNVDEDRIQKLMRLKRHEEPPEGFFDDFLREFHQRQRQELLKRSSLSLFMERVNTYLSDPRSQGWAYAPVVALFLVAFYCIIGLTDDSPLPSVPTFASVHQIQQLPADQYGAVTPVAYSPRGPFPKLSWKPQPPADEVLPTHGPGMIDHEEAFEGVDLWSTQYH